MDFLMIILTLVIGALWIYLFGRRKHNYFKELGIPYVKPTPMFGNVAGILFRTKTAPEFTQEAYDVHPDAKYCGVYEFFTPVIVIRDPELIKSVTIKDFDSFMNHKLFSDAPSEPLFNKNLFALKDDAWRDMRGLLSPAFTSSKMKMMFKTLSPCAINFADHLEKLDPRPEELDIKDTFARYTLDVIASAAFGFDTNSIKNPDNEFYRIGKSVADFSGLKMLKFVILRICPRVAEIFKIRFVDDKSADYFTKVIETAIATREAQGIVRSDMIQLMMQARDRKEKAALSTEDITAQAFVFLLGGFESPATTMSFAAYSLALNPDVQRKLQTEIDEVLERNSGEVSYEDLHAMKYLDGVVSETLRMFPPTVVLDRIATKSFTLPPALPGLKPLEIKPGQAISIASYSIHRDPRYFPDPEKFDPERFFRDDKSKINPLTYMPFGIGPRICIANRFALMEVKLALFHLLSKCDLIPTSKSKWPIKLGANFSTMTPEGGFFLKVEPRR